MLTGIQKSKIIDVLNDPDSFATTLITLLIDLYGAEVLNYEQATIDLDLRDDFGVELPAINRDKIEALRTVMTTDLAQNDWLVFNQICEALNNDRVFLDVLDPITPEQAAWGLVEIQLLEEDFQLSEEVRRYLGAILLRSGLTRKAGILKVAIIPEQEYTATPMEDPEMQTAVFAKEQSDLDYINEYVLERTQELFKQLDAVPLQHRDAESWKAFQNRVSDRFSR